MLLTLRAFDAQDARIIRGLVGQRLLYRGVIDD